MRGWAGGQVTRCVGREHFWYHQFFAHLLRLKIMPAGAKVVKYEGDGDPDAPLADGQVVFMFKETCRMVKTEDARLKIMPAGAKVVKSAFFRRPPAPPRGQLEDDGARRPQIAGHE